MTDREPSWDDLFERASAFDVDPDAITDALEEVRNA